MKDLIVRGALVVLAAAAVVFPLIDVPSAPNFSGNEIMHPRILGNLAFLVPVAFALAAVHYFTRAGHSIQKVIDVALLAIVVAGGAFLIVLLIGASQLKTAGSRWLRLRRAYRAGRLEPLLVVASMI